MSWPLQQLRRCPGQIDSLYFQSSQRYLPLRPQAAGAFAPTWMMSFASTVSRRSR